MILFDAHGRAQALVAAGLSPAPRRRRAALSARPASRLPGAITRRRQGVLAGYSCMRYYLTMNNQERNRSAQSMAAAERAHSRADGGGLGDIAIYILMRTCNVMMHERLGGLLAPHDLTPLGYMTMMALYSRAGEPGQSVRAERRHRRDARQHDPHLRRPGREGLDAARAQRRRPPPRRPLADRLGHEPCSTSWRRSCARTPTTSTSAPSPRRRRRRCSSC